MAGGQRYPAGSVPSSDGRAGPAVHEGLGAATWLPSPEAGPAPGHALSHAPGPGGSTQRRHVRAAGSWQVSKTD